MPEGLSMSGEADQRKTPLVERLDARSLERNRAGTSSGRERGKLRLFGADTLMSQTSN